MDGISEDKLVVNSSDKTSTTIYTLAPELLNEIFLHCVQTNSHLRRLSEAPLLLGRVCSWWRTVSVFSPVLWTRFNIVEDPGWQIDWKKDLEATKVWISRSGSCSLSICLVYPQLWGETRLLLIPILESLIPQSWRWKDVYVSIPSECGSVMLAPFWTGALSELQSFDGRLTGNENSNGVQSLALSSAPKLQRFRLARAVGGHIDFGGRIHDIKILDIHQSKTGISPDDFLTCLTHCPLLEELTFVVNELASIHPQELPPIIELPHLRHFNLFLSQGIDTGYLLDLLVVPGLIHLTVVMEFDNSSYTDWRHLKLMLARSRPSLETLTIHVPMVEEALCECLCYIPSLITLGLDGIECTDFFLDFLTVDKNDPSKNFCPCLKTLEILCASRFSSSAMTAMILSRHSCANDASIGTALQKLNCRGAEMGNLDTSSQSLIAECIKKWFEFYSTTY